MAEKITRLTPLQRAYLMGFRRAKALAKREREELADQFFQTLGEIHSELSDMKNEVARVRAIGRAAESSASLGSY